MRIVSLCPSQTETLWELGLGSQLVGRTDYCTHPQPGIDTVPSLGGTKNFSIEKILALKPDLVIAEKEENPKDRTLKLAESVPVHVTDVRSISDALKMISDLGRWTHASPAAEKMVQEIKTLLKLEQVTPLPTDGLQKNLCARPKVLYLIWKDPWMAAGPDTYIHSVLEWLGFQNACWALPPEHLARGRYPKLTLEDMRKSGADRIFLSSEPYSFAATDADLLKGIAPRIQPIDGQSASWYGVRMKSLLRLKKEIQ